MSIFRTYFELGVEHILGIDGLDHILFILALCSIYLLRDWRRVIILVTAFTVGHTLTLILVTLDFFTADSAIIEFMIPVTIFITAGSNIVKGSSAWQRKAKLQVNYLYAGIFGLIHGMAFANDLKALLGKDKQIIEQLLSFNLGLEIGQIILVLGFLTMGGIIISVGGVNRRDWNLGVNSSILGISVILMLESSFW